MALKAWYPPLPGCQLQSTRSEPGTALPVWVLPCVLLSVALWGCDEDRPSAAPDRDGGGGRDAAVAEAGTRDGGPPARRDGGPVFPPVDLEVALPYRGPEETLAIAVSADPGRLDVQLSMDTTGSFGEEIDAIQADLEGRIVPDLAARVEDVAFGVSRFEDFPAEPWGTAGDVPFELLTAITTDLRRVASAVASLDSPLGHGGDAPESGAEALYQIATGEGYRHGGRTIVRAFTGAAAPGGGTLGGVGFREGALHVVVHVTDAPAHAPEDYGSTFPGTHSSTDAADALSEIGARVVGIASGDIARPHLEQLALATGAVTPADGGRCATGIDGEPRPPVGSVCPLVFGVASDGTGLSGTIVDAIVELVNGVAYDEVYGDAIDDPLGFVRSIEASEAEAPAGVPAPGLADRRPAGDGVDDTFLDVRAGTRLVFVAHLANRTLPPADYDQVFHVAVEIRGGELLLARRRIRVIVPRGRLDAGTSADAGLDATAPADGGLDAASDGGA